MISSNESVSSESNGDFHPKNEETLSSRRNTYVYIKDNNNCWIPGELLEYNKNGTAKVRIRSDSSQAGRRNEFSPIKGENQRFARSEIRMHAVIDGESLTSSLVVPSMPQDNKERTEDSRYVTMDVNASESFPLQCVDDDGKLVTYADMRDLPYLHEASILYNLKARYESKTIIPYTRTGDILVAVNPYQWIDGLYAEKCRLKYAENLVWKVNPKALAELPPHLYETSSKALKGLTMDGKDQSILVSGESGAGKTVSVKILMSHLATFHELKEAYVSRHLDERENLQDECQNLGTLGKFLSWMSQLIFGQIPSRAKDETKIDDIKALEGLVEEETEPDEMNQTNLIVQRVLDSNPLLEAFGNGKTIKNDNSSRFSKFVKLQFHVEYLGRANPSCNIAGSLCDTYLLEKSRVVRHNHEMNERTFHIFYQLLSAPDSHKADIWHHLEGKDSNWFKYLGYHTSHKIEGLTDRQHWGKTISALHSLGIKGKELKTLFQAVCAVLQLGNISFDTNPSNAEESIISNTDELDLLSEVLGIPGSDIAQALTFKTMHVIGEDSISIPQNSSAAKSTCDAFAKEIYSRIFNWLVSAINDATCATKNYENAGEVSKYHHIGILDIFGFECFETNHFEQLLINHANERLQMMFTESVFKSVYEEYKSEGVYFEDIEFVDNREVLNFIEGRMGLMSVLNEECIRPRGCDTGFVNKINSSKSNSSKSVLVFKKSYHLNPTMFGINHFAGPVDYDATDFVNKNMDALPDDIIKCGLKSSNKIVHSAMVERQNEKPKRKGALITYTIWTKFRKQLDSLFSQLSETREWYVRCINPNKVKEAGFMDEVYTLSQLQHAGILSALKMSRAAFPNRSSFSFALDRFWFLADHDFLQAMEVDLSEGTKNLQKGYSVWKMLGGKKLDERRDVKILLDHLLKPLQLPNVSNDSQLYVLGKSRIYFREGILEYLESKRAESYERCATKIQACIRGASARNLYGNLKETKKTQIGRNNKCFWMPTFIRKHPHVLFVFMPLFLMRFDFGFRSSNKMQLEY